MWTEEKKDRLRATSLIFVFTTLFVFLFAAFAAHLSAQTPDSSQNVAKLPATSVTARVNYPPGQGAKIKGLIVGRNGDDMSIRGEDGNMYVTTLTADTKIQSPSGLFKMERKPRDVTSLLPGLIVEVKGTGGDRGNLIADKITFHSSALRVAEQIAAGTVTMKMAISDNKDSISSVSDSVVALRARIADSLAVITARARDSLAAIHAKFDDLDKYETRNSTTVNFAINSAKLTDDDKKALDGLASSAMAEEGFLIEVKGFADATGGEAHNLQLSERRADAVVNYLVRERNVPIRRVLNPTGFGEEDPVASNSTSSGRALNRRAEVKILVNRAALPK